MNPTPTNPEWERAGNYLRFVGASLRIFSLCLLSTFGAESASPNDQLWVAPGRAARKDNPILTDAASIAQGKELFTAACLPCHGPTGKGDGPASATLERDGKPIKPGNLSDPRTHEQSDGALFWKISEGRTPMPAYQEPLTEEQRWKIVIYVRTLAPKSDTKKP